MFKDRIIEAINTNKKIQIVANQSKVKLKDNVDMLDISNYQGVISYYPEELVITVKAGTKLSDLKEILAQNNQILAFEPPDYNNSSIGGSYALALSGSGAYFRGYLRDFVLGIKIIDGKGNELNFGGQMMKNVAGYDVARLLVGSRGRLALITEISFKVLPKVKEQTYMLEISNTAAIKLMNKMASSSLPLSACAYYQDKFYYRLYGDYKRQDAIKTDATIWQILNPLRPKLNANEFLQQTITTSTAKVETNTLAVDWCGVKRYILATKGIKTKKDKNIKIIEEKLKNVFDPYGIFI